MRWNSYNNVVGLLADTTGPAAKGFRARVYDMGGGSSTTVAQQYSPEEAAQRVKVMDEARRIYDTTANSMSSAAYPGAVPIPFSPETLASQQYATEYALGPGLQQANNLNEAVRFGLKDVLFPQTNPALQQTIAASIRPIIESYNDPGGVMSQIRSSGINYGQYGGSRQGIAEGIAAGRALNAISDAAAKVATEGYKSGLDTFGRTMAFAPQAIEAGMLPANVLGAVGAQNEALASEMENYLANARMWGLNAPWIPLQNYASIVFGGSNPTTVSTQDVNSSPLQTIGSIAQLALAAKMLMAASDRRLKRNIRKVGVDDGTGLNIYEFEYKAHPGLVYRGVMADEVIEDFPEAVMTDHDGYMMVNYSMLGIPFVLVTKGDTNV